MRDATKQLNGFDQDNMNPKPGTGICEGQGHAEEAWMIEDASNTLMIGDNAILVNQQWKAIEEIRPGLGLMAHYDLL